MGDGESRVIGKIVAACAGLVCAFAAVVFGVLWNTAEPRLQCKWDVEFCSDYGRFYAAFAIFAGVIAIGLFWRAFKRNNSQ
jgi:hypothetical protein